MRGSSTCLCAKRKAECSALKMSGAHIGQTGQAARIASPRCGIGASDERTPPVDGGHQHLDARERRHLDQLKSVTGRQLTRRTKSSLPTARRRWPTPAWPPSIYVPRKRLSYHPPPSQPRQGSIRFVNRTANTAKDCGLWITHLRVSWGRAPGRWAVVPAHPRWADNKRPSDSNLPPTHLKLSVEEAIGDAFQPGICHDHWIPAIS